MKHQQQLMLLLMCANLLYTSCMLLNDTNEGLVHQAEWHSGAHLVIPALLLWVGPMAASVGRHIIM
jgi:hypothetical protein